jgi:hypothetical protein
MEIIAAGITVPKAARNEHGHLHLCPACQEGFDSIATTASTTSHST